jgi:hypothetical protein
MALGSPFAGSSRGWSVAAGTWRNRLDATPSVPSEVARVEMAAVAGLVYIAVVVWQRFRA